MPVLTFLTRPNRREARTDQLVRGLDRQQQEAQELQMQPPRGPLLVLKEPTTSWAKVKLNTTPAHMAYTVGQSLADTMEQLVEMGTDVSDALHGHIGAKVLYLMG